MTLGINLVARPAMEVLEEMGIELGLDPPLEPLIQYF
jgi:hypothetical protein